jgi:hypothetical protein
MLLDALILAAPVIFALLWLWPEEDPKDPYDDPKNWGDQ